MCIINWKSRFRTSSFCWLPILPVCLTYCFYFGNFDAIRYSLTAQQGIDKRCFKQSIHIESCPGSVISTLFIIGVNIFLAHYTIINAIQTFPNKKPPLEEVKNHKNKNKTCDWVSAKRNFAVQRIEDRKVSLAPCLHLQSNHRLESR